MEKYISYSNKENYKSHILFNDLNETDKNLFIHEIGTSYLNLDTFRSFVRKTYVIHFVYRGSIIYMGKEVSAGEIFVMFPDEFSHFKTKEGSNWASSWIKLSGELVEKYLKDVGITPENHIYSNTATTKIATLLKDAVFADYENEYIHFKLTSLFFQILSLYNNESNRLSSFTKLTKTEEYIQQSVKYIKENYFNEITPSEIAKNININTNYLCRLFKSRFNMSIKSYITQYRVFMAEILLSETNLSISEISVAVGYYDAHNFSQVFRKHTSFTPTQFREKKIGIKFADI